MSRADLGTYQYPIQWILGVIPSGQNVWNAKLITIPPPPPVWCRRPQNVEHNCEIWLEEAGLGRDVRLECRDPFESITPLLVRRDWENHEIYQEVCWLRFFYKGDIQFDYCVIWVTTFLDSYRRMSGFHLEIRDNHLLPDPYIHRSNLPIHLLVCSPNFAVETASKQ
jgi:hypothetical protein